MNHFNLRAVSNPKLLAFLVFTHLYAKVKETNELHKQEKGKREVKNPAAVFVNIRVLAALIRSQMFTMDFSCLHRRTQSGTWKGSRELWERDNKHIMVW